MSGRARHMPVDDDIGLVLAYAVPALALAGAAVAGFVWLALAVDAVRGSHPLPVQPLRLGPRLLAGEAAWPSPVGWTGAGLLVGLPLAGLAAVVVRAVRRVTSRSVVDRRTRYLAGPGDRRRLELKARIREAARLVTGRKIGPGLPIGVTIPARQLLFQGWEDVSVDVWGPRRGKTTTRAVPAMLAAPGAVVATSNKRDLYDTTAGVRGRSGLVWCFDPQALATDGEPTFTYDPLAGVQTAVQAQRLAALFAADTKEPGARTDPQWDTAGADLLAWLMLAAASSAWLPGRRYYLPSVWDWVADPADDTPVELLSAAGHHGPAGSVAAVQHQPDKMRGSVYGTAQRMARPLINPQLLRWVTPSDTVASFDPVQFVDDRSRDTLYALSREGAGSAGAIVTALTSAVCEAAEQRASRSRSGRLPVPLVAVLDEAANVCRWPELPQLYSHYGSRGIALMTFLQSYSQGVTVWGEEGMRTLWSAATIRVYGGGVADQRWLAELSDLIGDHDERHRSHTHRRGERSTSIDTRQRRTLTTAELAALPRDRAVLLSGDRPIIVEPQPWYTGPDADLIRETIQQSQERSPRDAT